jgi:hypothetical protein
MSEPIPASDLPPTPGFDPSESPLSPGGRPDPFGRNASAAEHLRGIVDFPTMPHPRRAIYRVRREGWVARREQARSRYRDVHEKAPSSSERILGKLEARGGILMRARENAVRPRFNMRRARPSS